jgi:hypothetical protein
MCGVGALDLWIFFQCRHFIATLHDNMEYVERQLVVDIGGFNFVYQWHEITDKGFTLAMPWKLRVCFLSTYRYGLLRIITEVKLKISRSANTLFRSTALYALISVQFEKHKLNTYRTYLINIKLILSIRVVDPDWIRNQ